MSQSYEFNANGLYAPGAKSHYRNENCLLQDISLIEKACIPPGQSHKLTTLDVLRLSGAARMQVI